MSSDVHTDAGVLNRYFSSVFTQEDTLALPPPVPLVDRSLGLRDLRVTPELVRLKLRQLKTSSSPGPDG